MSQDLNVGQTPIQLITDSASDIPEDMARKRNITIVPLTVSVNGQEYQDGVSITPPRFYSMMAKKGALPVTSPPAPETFHEIFNGHIGQRDILGIFISRKMSNTFDVASQTKMNNYNTYLKQRMAHPQVNKKMQIELIDSRLVSMGATLLVLEAADKIEAGWPLDKIKDLINQRINDVKVFFMVDNLDHLVRGGRIGRGSALFGKLLGFKPILGMAGGGVDAKSKSFGGKRAQGKLIEYMKNDLGGTSQPVRIGICHAGAPEKATTVRNLVQEAFPNQEHYTTYFGPTVGAHTGPGAVGVAWLPYQEE
ncbi:DegV family protein [Desulfopila sp. IMCC35008]|uniref:DegV family protein n=1 Tax=Desulfopila sp. IMCC35008 TaxID=2653858 RepID=UPI0013D74153|nr:DegV family protein [Desulfopila sp. IMCC35008]